MGLAGHQIAQERRRIGEIEHPGAAGAQPDQQPDRPFRQPQPGLAQAHGLTVQAQLGVSVALDPTFDQHEKIGPDGLRAGIAAPDPAQRRGKEEEAETGHDQQPGDEIEFMRPDLDPEEIEPPAGQVDQHRLIGQAWAPVPANPGHQIIDAQGDRHDRPFQIAEPARDALGKDRFARLVEALLCRVGQEGAPGAAFASFWTLRRATALT